MDSEYDVFAAGCPSRKVFDHIFSRWGMLILARLDVAPVRFKELARAIEGISERMLSKTLKILEEEELVVRIDYNEKPPHVEYQLSDSGRRLSASVQVVIKQLYSELDARRHKEKS